MAEAQDGPGLGWAGKYAILFSTVPVTIASTAVSPVLPKMLTAFAANPNAELLVKQMVGFIGIAMAFGCPLGGWIAQRYNHRVVLALAYLAYAIVGGLAFFISDLYLLLASRIVLGLAAAILATVSLVALSDRVSGHQRNTLLGAVLSLGMISGMLSFPAGGFLGSINWRLVFLIYLVAAPFSVLSLLMPKGETPRPVADAGSSTVFSLPYRLMALSLTMVVYALLDRAHLRAQAPAAGHPAGQKAW